MTDKMYDDLIHKYSLALEMIETELNVLLQNYEYTNDYYPVDHIKSRVKSRKSIEKKLKNKNLDITIDNIVNHVHDLIGVRIVCSFIPDVYDIVSLIKNNSRYKVKDETDYIKKPKDTGYMSYHINLLVPIYLGKEETLIEVEVQVRTMAMDFWASLDHKIVYKFEKIPDEVRKEMQACSQDIKALDEKMNKLNVIAMKYR